MSSKLKTIKDLKNQHEWWDINDCSEKLEIVINTLFMAGKINEELKMSLGDFGEATVELCCNEDDRDALQEGWIRIADKPTIEINLFQGDNSHYLINDDLWDYLYNLMEEVVDWD